MGKIYHAAVYLRLSREDGDVVSGGRQVSNSISNQKELVMDYVQSHQDIRVQSVYTDDGYSGVNFERPEFQKMLNAIREGVVDCVIVKDLSRFGRNYIESGRYIEKIFPMLGVRFIAITDNYDSLNNDVGNDMIIPFKNLINDAYCRDISVKIRSHMDIKRRNGEYIGPFAAYGYRKDPENKNHLIVDEYAADVVRDIFAMKLCGMSQQAIADKLNADGILAPIQYKQSMGIPLESSFVKSEKPKWSYNTVLRILKNEVYTGMVVQGKCTTPNYKIKKRIHKEEKEWIRVENTHEAIISKNEFDIVQLLLGRDTRVAPSRESIYPLAGLLYCADCGSPMVRKTIPSGKKKFVYYICADHKRDKNLCSPHRISAGYLEEKILKLVQLFVSQVLTLADAMEILDRAPEVKPDVLKYDDRIKVLKEQMDSCSRHKKNLYEDFKDGILTKEEYSLMKEQYDGELRELQLAVLTVEEERQKLVSGGSVRKEWISSIKKYGNINRLDRSMLVLLIDRIEVVDAHTIQVKYRFEQEIRDMRCFLEQASGKEAV